MNLLRNIGKSGYYWFYRLYRFYRLYWFKGFTGFPCRKLGTWKRKRNASHLDLLDPQQVKICIYPSMLASHPSSTLSSIPSMPGQLESAWEVSIRPILHKSKVGPDCGQDSGGHHLLWVKVAELGDFGNFLHFWLFVSCPVRRSVWQPANWVQNAISANITENCHH